MRLLPVETEMTAGIAGKDPLGRAGQVQDIANAVAVSCITRIGYITNRLLP